MATPDNLIQARRDYPALRIHSNENQYEQGRFHRSDLSIALCRRNRRQGAPVVRFRHEEIVDRRTRLSLRRACRRLRQCGRPLECLGRERRVWGLDLGLSVWLSIFLIPGLGPLVVGGLNALGAGLFSLGTLKDSILQDETALKSDKFVLIIHGSAAETTHAKPVLTSTAPERLQHHLAPQLV